MTINGIHSITRKNMLISYRREYKAKALISFHNKEARDYNIEFSLELSPLGSSTIRVKIVDDLDYPSLPITNALKEEVHKLDHAGDLP